VDTSAQETKGATGRPDWSAWKEYQDFQASILRLGVTVMGVAKGPPYDPAASYIPETAAALHKWFILVLELGNRKSKGRGKTAAAHLQLVLWRLDSIRRWLRFRGNEGLLRTIEGHIYELQKAVGKGADKDFDARWVRLLMAEQSLLAELQGIAAMSAAVPAGRLGGDRKEQPWADDAPDYLPNSIAVKLAHKVAGDTDLDVKKLGKLCLPDGAFRYMRNGQRTKVHVGDFMRWLKETTDGAPSDEIVGAWLEGVERRKQEAAQQKRTAR